MGQLDLDYNPVMGCYLTLSTGAVADMTSCNIEEAIDSVDNLLSMTVMEHFEKILKTYNQTGEDLTVELIEAEIDHLIENEFSDNLEGALKFFLMTLSIQRYIYITDEVRKKQEKKKKKLKKDR